MNAKPFSPKRNRNIFLVGVGFLLVGSLIMLRSGGYSALIALMVLFPYMVYALVTFFRRHRELQALSRRHAALQAENDQLRELIREQEELS